MFFIPQPGRGTHVHTHNNEINHVFLIFNTMELFSEKTRLASFNLSGTYQGEPSTKYPSYTTPRQPTLYLKTGLNQSCLVQGSIQISNWVYLINHLQLCFSFQPGFRRFSVPEGEPQIGDWHQPGLDLYEERDIVRHRSQVRARQTDVRSRKGQQLQPNRFGIPTEVARW